MSFAEVRGNRAGGSDHLVGEALQRSRDLPGQGQGNPCGLEGGGVGDELDGHGHLRIVHGLSSSCCGGRCQGSPGDRPKAGLPLTPAAAAAIRSPLHERFGGKRQLIVDFGENYGEVHVDGADVTERVGTRVTYHFERGTVTASELIGRLSNRFRIRDLEVREPNIEDTIRRIYEEQLLSRG